MPFRLVSHGEQKEHRVPKPVMGHLKKAGVGPVARLQECRTDSPDQYEVGQSLTLIVSKASRRLM